jgi:hypothetical protein
MGVSRTYAEKATLKLRATEVCAVFNFYRRICLSAISEFQSVKAKVLFWAAIVLSIVGFFNQQLADAVSRKWKGVPRYWSVVFIGLVVAHRILQANYQAFSALEQRVKRHEDEEEIQSTLGVLLAEGADLRVDRIETEAGFVAWLARFSPWRQSVLDSLGNFGLAADYALFQNADALGELPPVGITRDWREEVKEYDQILKHHLHALAGILRTRPKITFEAQERHERELF